MTATLTATGTSFGTVDPTALVVSAALGILLVVLGWWRAPVVKAVRVRARRNRRS
jgi:hypothetical protein